MTNLILATLLTLYLLNAIRIWAKHKPKGRAWRCHAGIHKYQAYGYREECERCGKRRNIIYPLYMLKNQLRRLFE